MPPPRKILYCHCAYAQAVPKLVKDEVLSRLCAAGAEFDAVADICEMSARKDPALKKIAADGDVQIVACYPRAVKWLFAAAGVALPEQGVEFLNMRVANAAEIAGKVLGEAQAAGSAS
jgi:hypothetical protein